ncbi:MAG: tetratricopeptide repeat protein [Deltaproteobacteria bacterium]|nr:MAG: tetratricopeptide repeat protein [Deltaproteobacteria bacterium]
MKVIVQSAPTARMRVRVALLSIALCMVVAPCLHAESPSEVLERARAEFEYKNFENAAALLETLLKPTVKLSTEQQIVEARQMLGLCYFYLGKFDEARGQFRALLYLRPDHHLDAFLVPPPAVEFFEKVRRSPDVAARLEQIRRQKQVRKEGEEKPRTLVKTVRLEREVRIRSRLLAFLPFGIGQFQNRHMLKGALVAGVQAAALIANMTCYGLLVALADENGHYASSDISLARGLQVGQYVGLGVFAAAWIYGVIDANLYFEPAEVGPWKQRSSEPEQSGDKGSASVGAGGSMGAGMLWFGFKF